MSENHTDTCATCGNDLEECINYSYCVRCLSCGVLQDDTEENEAGITVSELPLCPLCGGSWDGED